jgi:hypothetical protein
MKNKKISVDELIENLKAIRRRPIPAKDIEEFNKIVELDDEYERKNKKNEPKKIATPPEVDR